MLVCLGVFVDDLDVDLFERMLCLAHGNDVGASAHEAPRYLGVAARGSDTVSAYVSGSSERQL